jgi:protein arginine N-methyltransferase 1
MRAADGYSIQDYGDMVNDRMRTAPFVEALRQAVKPGDVVLDIGTGAGIFALLACRFGAARVYAVEPNDAIEVAKLCARDIPGGERITWIKGFSTELDLPEKVDVVIGDLHGTLPLYPGNITSMMDARRRLMKPGGRVIPARDTLYVVPAHAPSEYRQVDLPWAENEHGLDLSAGRRYVANSWWRAAATPVLEQNLLADPATWGVVDYASIESPNLDGRMQWRIARDGLCHGYYAWFDGEMAPGLGYSNAPQLPELVYGRAFFPLEQAVALQAGDTMEARFSAHWLSGKYLFRWDTRVLGADGVARADFRQTTFKDRPLQAADLAKARADHVPRLDADGRAELTVLQAMAEGLPLGDIAARLQALDPARFGEAHLALAQASRIAARHSRNS